MVDIPKEELEKIKKELEEQVRKELASERAIHKGEGRLLKHELEALRIKKEQLKLEKEKQIEELKQIRADEAKRLKKEMRKKKKVVKTVAQKLAKQDKANVFLMEFLKTGNVAGAAMKTTGTNSAIRAAKTGEAFLKDAKILARTYLEKQGLGYGALIEIAAEKMMTSKNPEWWDRLMKLAEYEDFINKKNTPSQPQVVNVIQTQKELAKEFGFGEVIEGEESDK